MLLNRFQNRIALVMVALLLVVIASLSLAVQLATNRAVDAQARQQLEGGSRVLSQLLANRARKLDDAVQLLVVDPAFRQLLRNDDQDAIEAELINHTAHLNASIALLYHPDDQLLASSASIDDVRGLITLSAAYQQAPSHQRIHLAPLAEQVYLWAESTISDPLPVARLRVGILIDQEIAHELHELTGQELSILARINNWTRVTASTLNRNNHDALITQFERLQLRQEPGITAINGHRYLTRQLPLASTDQYQITALLHNSLDTALARFAPLHRQILIISAIALCASLLGAVLLARNMSQPVRQLAAAASRVGDGDFAINIDLPRRDELGQLALAFNNMQQGLAERERQLAHNALHDSSSGLPNRLLAEERIRRAITNRQPLSLMALTLRGLAEANSNNALEKQLQELIAKLQPLLSDRDTLARPSPSELLFILPGSDSDGALTMADQVLARLKPTESEEHTLGLQICLGVACYPADGQDAETLMRRAHLAMRDARNLPERVAFYQQGRDDIHQRQLRLIRELRQAALRGEFELHYQPKLDLRSGQIRQVEALLRWRHSELGLISPTEFIPLAERTGSISLLSHWVISEAIRQLASWRQQGWQLQVSINVSADDLLGLDLVTTVGQLLQEHQLPGSWLMFEITESTVMREPKRALSQLYALRELGISLSVDDFGTGYSSLAQLKQLPVQELKIDQSFVRELCRNSDDAVIVRSTIEMSHNLGLKVVAEGVENAPCMELLSEWGCDSAQGFLVGRPLSAGAFSRWLQQRQSHETSQEAE